MAMLFDLVAVPCFIFYIHKYPLWFSRLSYQITLSDSSPLQNEQVKLERVLKAASTKDKTVILTTLNEAWTTPNSILDLFLESFKIGENTKNLLSHLVISCIDHKAYERCLKVHPHCYALNTEGVDFSKEAYFGSPNYLKMVWRKIYYQKSVLELGYNFIFTDADIMWFRDPFTRFYESTDFQISCDNYLLNNSYDLHNNPNSSFEYVRSNNRTIRFYEFWYNSRLRYPNRYTQYVLHEIKHDPFIREIGLTIRFLNTLYFGGFCEPSKDFNQVCTMHANCCKGEESKLHDLGLLLDDWRNYKALSLSDKSSWNATWRAPEDCSIKKKLDRHHIPKKLEDEGKKD
ncbi:hypothetical protein MKW94_008785 [Papaver nudicaule]|uniref:Nucleotide-diphospho-sugar transferase domain-containing protein n=1 Tax=Papaver nudicaule TaxID=74823 RepID=A0AA41VZU9_PAPNU|nr:hypothetical protein [Papaver nudicaule]